MKNALLGMACALISLSGCSSQPDTESTCRTHEKSSLELVMNFTRKIKPEHVSAFRDSFLKCKVETDKEPGCLDYNIYQSTTDSTIFMITETWKNEEELRKHGETPHLKLHISEIKGMAEESYKGYNRRVYVCPKVNE